ncbi:hypothetical protein MNV49_006150 [Pseudohyphozyma bogoriensis]|nr:hypothetical protein MNV49_006150 [Pseudohyphozyma bogoriensis]
MYLRTARLCAFALTTSLSIATVGLAAWALKRGVDKKDFVKHSIPGATLDISNMISAGSVVTAAAGHATFLCLLFASAAIFIPNREETQKTICWKEYSFAYAAVFYLGSLLAATIIYATKSGKITKPGVSQDAIAQIVALSEQDLRYRKQDYILPYIITGWLAFASVLLSLVLVSLAARHMHKHGAQGSVHHPASTAPETTAGPSDRVSMENTGNEDLEKKETEVAQVPANTTAEKAV